MSVGICGCNSPPVSKEMSVSTGNVVELSSLVPEIDFLKVELLEIEIVLESLVDCGGFDDMFRSLISLISSCDAADFCLFS